MFYLGIDVSKAKLDGCLLNEDTPDKRKNKTVANSAAGIADLLHWLHRQGAVPAHTHALLEGTGVYHESAANYRNSPERGKSAIQNTASAFSEKSKPKPKSLKTRAALQTGKVLYSFILNSAVGVVVLLFGLPNFTLESYVNNLLYYLAEMPPHVSLAVEYVFLGLVMYLSTILGVCGFVVGVLADNLSRLAGGGIAMLFAVMCFTITWNGVVNRRWTLWWRSA